MELEPKQRKGDSAGQRDSWAAGRRPLSAPMIARTTSTGELGAALTCARLGSEW